MRLSRKLIAACVGLTATGAPAQQAARGVPSSGPSAAGPVYKVMPLPEA